MREDRIYDIHRYKYTDYEYMNVCSFVIIVHTQGVSEVLCSPGGCQSKAGIPLIAEIDDILAYT